MSRLPSFVVSAEGSHHSSEIDHVNIKYMSRGHEVHTIVGSPVIKINGLPIGVIAGIEGPAVRVELVAKHKLIFFIIIIEAPPRSSALRRCGIDQGREIRYFWHLTSGIYTANVPSK